VPTGVSLASIMLASGNTRRQTMLGAVLRWPWPPCSAPGHAAGRADGHYGLALAAGVTLYVAASNLIPEVAARAQLGVQGGLFLGVIVVLPLQPAAAAH
jgi:zinc transporter ZupT